VNTCCILKSILGYQVSDDITDSYERYPRNALPNPDFWHRKFTITYRHLYNGVCPGRSHLTQGRSTYWRDRKRNKYWITVYMHYQTWTNTNVTWRKTKDEEYEYSLNVLNLIVSIHTSHKTYIDIFPRLKTTICRCQI
jgi:hypothetical protein